MTDVKLKVNDKLIPLNEMMREMLENLIMGYLKTAKGTPDEIRSINVEIQL